MGKPDTQSPSIKHRPFYSQITRSRTCKMLSTIYEWSVEHIKNVFEAKSEDECIKALDETFSQHIDFSTNGKQLNRADLQRFVLSMVQLSGFRLKVQWQNALEVPRDETNRVSCVV